MKKTSTSQHKYRLVNGHREWTGSTMKAAQAARDEDLNRLFANYGDEIPVLITASPGRQGLVFQRPDGFFSYRLIRDGVAGGIVSPAGASKDEAERFCRRHLAQDVFELQVAFDEFVNVKVYGSSVIAEDDEEGKSDHCRWVTFQIVYAKARASGKSDQEAHAAASAAQ